jgi:hypothetical protein
MIDLEKLIDLSHCMPVPRQKIDDMVDASGKHIPLLATHVGSLHIRYLIGTGNE